MEEREPNKRPRTYKMQWTQNQKIIACGLFLIEKDFQEIADELNKYIKREAEGYDITPHRSDRAVAYQCMNLGLISKEVFEEWDKKRNKKRDEDRGKNYRKERKKVFDRDGNQCVFCNVKEHLRYSHIIPFKQTRLNMETETITLCEEHHKKFDNGDTEIGIRIFEKMCEYYENYKDKYYLDEWDCDFHGKHAQIKRSGEPSNKEN